MEEVSVDERADGSLRIVLRGEIDFNNAASVIEVIRGAVARQRPEHLDSSGLAVLVNAMKAAEAVGAAYRVEQPNLKVTDQLRITGLLEPFGLAET